MHAAVDSVLGVFLERGISESQLQADRYSTFGAEMGPLQHSHTGFQALIRIYYRRDELAACYDMGIAHGNELTSSLR